MSNKRTWVAPLATALSIRSTAGGVGPGPDNFLKFDYSHRPGGAPAAPLADVGVRPISSQFETVKTDSAEWTWESPAVTTLVI